MIKQSYLKPILEKSLLEKYDLIVGIDEAGRGPWAGPVSISGYFFAKSSPQTRGVNDSKKLLPKHRNQVYKELTLDSNTYTNLLISSLEIDKIGIGKSIEQAITSIISQVQTRYRDKRTIFLIDGYFKQKFECEYELIKGGDSKVYSIACASIISKVIRDEYMLEMAKKYPFYGFDKHMGYGTKMHLESIQKYGICQIHRKSFRPMRDM